MRKAIMMCVLALSSAAALAAEFPGKFDGCAEGAVILNGRQFPVRLDISADYRGQLVTICRIPLGTRVTYTLETLDGISTVASLVVTEVNSELNELFPPR